MIVMLCKYIGILIMYQQSTDPKVYRHDDFLRFISDAKYYNSVLTIIYQDRIMVFRPVQVHILQNSIIADLIIRI